MDSLVITAVQVSLACLGVSALVALYRAVTGRSVTEQIVVLEFLLGLIIGGIALDIIETGETALLDVMLIVAFISFVSAVALSRFLRVNHGGDS